MKRLAFFALGLLLGLICLPLTASLRERVRQAWREFRAGWYGSGGYEARGGGDAPALDGRVNSDDSEKVWIISQPSELTIKITPLPE